MLNNENTKQKQRRSDQDQDPEEDPLLKGESYEVDPSQLTSLIPKTLAGHAWIQRGPHLVCTSCVIPHSTWVGMSKRLFGIDDQGVPILKTVGTG